MTNALGRLRPEPPVRTPIAVLKGARTVPLVKGDSFPTWEPFDCAQDRLRDRREAGGPDEDFPLLCLLPTVRHLLPLALLLLAPLAVAAQTFEREVSPFPVAAGGEAVPYPFTGGFFEPRPSLVDIDADGDADLIVNVGGAGLQLFRRDGDEWVWQTDRLGGIEPGNWSTFADLDGDGDLDLLARGAPGRVRYWRNTGTAETPAFEVAADGLVTTGGEAVHVEDSSIPALADLDGDGDPELLSGKADLGTIAYYRHDGVDADGIPQFTFVSDTYQDIQVYEENPSCTGRQPAGIGDASRPSPGRMTSRHGANAIALVDLDGNGAPELFWGDFFAPSLFYFDNMGTPSDAEFVLESDRFPVGQPLTSGGYNAPTYGDVDVDGDADLVVGVQRGLCFQGKTTVSNLIYFENEGSASDPDLRLQTDRLIESLDVGTRSAAALHDLDADGDLDLVLANESNPADPSRANLLLYRNEGTAEAPDLRLEDADWLTLAYDYGAYAPVFGDLDGDGDADLLVGGFNGRFAFLRNTGTASDPEFSREDDRFGDVDAGQYARGTLGDLDGDGDLDLMTGASNGRVRLYRNTGGALIFSTQANGTPDSTDIAYGLSIGLPDDIGEDSAPALSDLDGDGDLDLLIGTATGEILTYQNVGTPSAPQFEEAAPIPAGRRRTTPTLGDLTGDGRPDLLAGTDSGGLLYWRSASATWTERPPESGDLGLRVVPNPSTGAVTFRADAGDGADLVVFDARGREVQRLAMRGGSVVWDGQDAGGSASGVYLAQLRDGERVQTVPFTRLR